MATELDAPPIESAGDITAAKGEGGVDYIAPGNGDDGDAGIADLEARAEAMYLKVMDMNMTFQENTAGEKVAKDQSGKVQN